jgi:NAD(P)-dependent dehydrogenase (short-subunit alcohol dehydrogenase family)
MCPARTTLLRQSMPGIAAFGRIDVLHNNVGIVEVGGPVETSEDSWDRVNDVNLKSIFLTRTRSCRG